MTGKYETMMVFSVKNGDDAAKALRDKFQALIEENGALVEHTEADGEAKKVVDWGKRSLAYPINYENDGWYTIFTYTCEPGFPAELDRVANITDGVLRLLTIRKDA